MRIESTHRIDSTVHVVTLKEIADDARAAGVDESTSELDGMDKLLVYNAQYIVNDVLDRNMMTGRAPARISSSSGEIPIPKKGIRVVDTGDCYTVEVNGVKRYAGDGNGNFGLVEKMMGGE